MLRLTVVIVLIGCCPSVQFGDSVVQNNIVVRGKRQLPLPEYHFKLPPTVKAETPILGVLPGLENGYSYCGENTRLQERLRYGYTGVNTLDRACLQHDIAYGQSTDETVRKQADYQLFQTATLIAQNPAFAVYERNHAVVIANSLATKFQSCATAES